MLKEKILKDMVFVLIEASKLSLDDEFMKYEPTTDYQWRFKRLLTEAINRGLSDFWRPKQDPSLKKPKAPLFGVVPRGFENIVYFEFEVRKKPAIGFHYNWWEKKSKQYLPERGSRLGTKTEYVAFLGVLIKIMVASGWSVSKAWFAVCDNSRELGHYWNSKNSKHGIELTGSREVCGFCDLANTYKILHHGVEFNSFWVAGGSYNDNSYNSPLANLRYRPRSNLVFDDGRYDPLDRPLVEGGLYPDAVGWLVLSEKDPWGWPI